jgi:membrane protease YdiL (CAAX protease family)
VAVAASAPAVGLMARAQGLFTRAIAPVPGTVPDDPAGTEPADASVEPATGPTADADVDLDADTGAGTDVVAIASDADGNDSDADAGDDATPTRRWGLGDAIGGWAIAQVASVLAIAAVVTSLGYPKVVGVGAAVGQAAGQTRVDVTVEILSVWGQLPIEWQVLLQVPLWLGLIGAPVYAARRKGTSLRKDFGLSVVRTDIPIGLVIGIACQLVLVPLVYVPFRLLGGNTQDVSEPAQQLVSSAVSPVGVLLLLLIVGVGAPFAEELFYRGLVQRSLLNRLGRPAWAIVLSAMFFAFAHMQSLQFPALVVVGVVFGILAWRSGRLGLSIFAHVGFNLTTAVVFLFDLTLPYS